MGVNQFHINQEEKSKSRRIEEYREGVMLETFGERLAEIDREEYEKHNYETAIRNCGILIEGVVALILVRSIPN